MSGRLVRFRSDGTEYSSSAFIQSASNACIGVVMQSKGSSVERLIWPSRRLLRLGLCGFGRRPRSVSAHSAFVCVWPSRCLPPCQALRIIMRKPDFMTTEQPGTNDTEKPRQSGLEITQSGRETNKATMTDHPENDAFLRPTESLVLLHVVRPARNFANLAFEIGSCEQARGNEPGGKADE